MTKHRLHLKTRAAFLFAFCSLIGLPFLSSAQYPDPQNPDQNVLPDQFESNDSLNVSDTDVPVGDSLTEDKISFDDVDFPTYEDSIYSTRLKAIDSPIPLDYNEEVKKYIDLYVVHRREQVSRMVGLSKFYFPLFEQIFSRYGVPSEMCNLAIIESALNPHAVSRAGAVGMWQFMYGTAKLYGLGINNYVDERRDIIRSTEGAAQYLKNMYDVYGDWLLAIASYNCGPQNVNRAIAKSGGSTFWQVRDFLPRETRGYVPAFIAATYVMNYYNLHDLEPTFPQYSWDSIVSIPIEDKMSCEQIAHYTSMTMDEVKFLNPGLRCKVIPALDNPYCFKMPSSCADMFYNNKDSIILASANAKQHFYFNSTGDARVYVVKHGDNLGKIAMRYHVSVAQIKRWNHLHSSLIRVGQHLRLYGSSGSSSSVASSSKHKTGSSTSKAQYVYYKTRSGDTLWDIARRHGTSITDLRSLNGAAKCNNLKAGTVLKIEVKG